MNKQFWWDLLGAFLAFVAAELLVNAMGLHGWGAALMWIAVIMVVLIAFEILYQGKQ